MRREGESARRGEEIREREGSGVLKGNIARDLGVRSLTGRRKGVERDKEGEKERRRRETRRERRREREWRETRRERRR